MTTGPMPPHAQFQDFLEDGLHHALLRWVAEHQTDFEPATVTKSKEGHSDRLDPDVRVALKLGELGPLVRPNRDLSNSSSLRTATARISSLTWTFPLVRIASRSGLERARIG